MSFDVILFVIGLAFIAGLYFISLAFEVSDDDRIKTIKDNPNTSTVLFEDH